MNDIADQLNIITAPMSQLSDQPVRDALDVVRRLLKPLIKLSKERGEECEKLGRELGVVRIAVTHPECSKIH